MKPFPPYDQLAFLIGAELSCVVLQPYSIDLNFVDGTVLVAEHGVEYVDERGKISAHDPQRRMGPDPVALHALIGDRVVEVDVEAFRLTLVFHSARRRLTVLSQPGPYESGQIRRAGQRFIVF